MRRHNRGVRAAVATLAVAAAVAGCTGGSSGGSSPSSTGSTPSGSASVTATPAGGPQPVWTREVDYPSIGATANRARVSVYPLQRVGANVLLTVDLAPLGAAGQKNSDTSHFCRRADACRNLSGVSLVDTTSRVRYGPLLSAKGGTPFTSTITQTLSSVGSTYRFGAFFADPGASVGQLAVDLGSGGVVTGVPIGDDAQPSDGLVLPAGTATPAVGSPGVTSGALVTWPVTTPGAEAYSNRHDLLARIVGGKVTQSGDVVSLNADVLFAFDKATLSGAAKGLIGDAAGIIAAKADGSKPVRVTGYTDAKGADAYNLDLSRRRAEAVRAQLATNPRTKSFSFSAQGLGKQDPVAPNKVAGKDYPTGRALNRRVEIEFTPKPAPAPTPAPSSSATSSAPSSAAATLGPEQITLSPSLTAGLTAAVEPVQTDGTLSVVRLTMTADRDFTAAGTFSGECTYCVDLRGFRLKDADGRAYVPAVDKDDHQRILSTSLTRLSTGVALTFTFVTAALPADLSQVQVVLDPIGSVTVPVQHQ